MKLATPSYIPLNKKVGLAPTFFFIPLPFLVYSVELVFIYPNYTIIHIVLIIHILFGKQKVPRLGFRYSEIIHPEIICQLPPLGDSILKTKKALISPSHKKSPAISPSKIRTIVLYIKSEHSLAEALPAPHFPFTDEVSNGCKRFFKILFIFLTQNSPPAGT